MSALDEAYEAGRTSQTGDKNPHKFGSLEYMEWNCGRIDGQVFEQIRDGQPRLARIIGGALVIALTIAGYDYLWM